MKIKVEEDDFKLLAEVGYKNRVEQTFSQLIEYLRHIEADYLQGVTENSAKVILNEFITQGAIPIHYLPQIYLLIDNPKMLYSFI